MSEQRTKETLLARLRGAAADIRRKPYPISDVIPLLTEAADRIERLQQIIDYYEPRVGSREWMEAQLPP